MNHTAEPGSISHGTLRTEDLLGAFLPALQRLAQMNRNATHLRLVTECEERAASYTVPLTDDDEVTAVDEPSWYETEEASTILSEDVFDALNDYAPDGHYFGAHEGDGADFGFWRYDA